MIGLRRVVPAAQIALRGDARMADAVRQAIGVVLPDTPNRVAAADGLDLLWLGPTAWLLVADERPAADLLPRLEAALAGRHAAVLDMSAARTVREIAGPGAHDLLARGCALDLHPRRFGPAHCAQTLLARCQVLLQQRDAAPTFRLFVRSSFAGYLDAWLNDAKSLLTPA